mgnify:CR=1 FL=1|tara:strand:- start:393 stop:860 length:468 start_codon:yes stop_codon:yes gene_type:complete
MATGYKLDADSVRLIDKVVRQVMAAEPTTRARQRHQGGGGQSASMRGVLGITLDDIPPAVLEDPPEDNPNAPKKYEIFYGKVARVELFFSHEHTHIWQKENPGHGPPGSTEATEGEFDIWYNTCSGKVHAGRLVQGKEITIGGKTITVVDVEPCE